MKMKNKSDRCKIKCRTCAFKYKMLSQTPVKNYISLK